MVNLAPFLAVAVVVIVTPGPDMALVLKNALRAGRRAALFTAFGVVTGLMVWTLASVLGIAALLRASATAFTVVKLLGAAYLVFLGIQALLSLRRSNATPPQKHRRIWVPSGPPYQQGLLSNLLNPKIAVFFTSLIPQFVKGPATGYDLASLGAIFVALTLVWLVMYALFASQAGELLRRPRVKRALDALTGCVLIGIGVRLAAERA